MEKVDLEEAVLECNFSKGLGPDGFDGNNLKDPVIKERLT